MPGGPLLITGGGTGGHVSPGLGVAAEWRRRHGSDAVAWVGRSGSLEEAMASRAGLAFHPVESAAFRRRWTINNLALPGVLLAGLRQARALIARCEPRAVLMTGGYVGLPLSLAAVGARLPLVLLEPNAVEGLANRLLRPLASRLCFGWPPEGAAKGRTGAVTGIPCRLGVLPGRGEALARLGLEPGRRTLLVLPGSQGAHAVNGALAAALTGLGDRAGAWQWLWMTGSADETSGKAAAAGAAFPVAVLPFIEDVADAYAAADLVLCRSGASTLAELAAAAKPSLQVPYPHATGDHQRANAALFVRAGAARALDERDLTPARLVEDLRSLLDSDLGPMGRAAAELARPDASARVADEIEAAVAGAAGKRGPQAGPGGTACSTN